LAAIISFISFYNKKIFSYSYSSIFPIKIAASPYNNNSGHYNFDNYLVHAKFYIFDDTEAYLGSINFTKAAFRKNYESRIKITDQSFIQKLIQEFNYLSDNKNTEYKDINLIGRSLYDEPDY
jgi:phosphatidylserine/phosphatidylglycerophosphate/cardiolipin synthase-like enzyme